MAGTAAGQTICYSCGRVITGSTGMDMRARGMEKGESTRGSRKGSHSAFGKQAIHSRVRRKKKKGKMRNLVLLIASAAILTLTPAQELVMGQWAQLNTILTEASSARHTYPVESSYTVERTILYGNEGTQPAEFSYHLPIPPQLRTAKSHGQTDILFKYDSDRLDTGASALQTLSEFIVGGYAIPPYSPGTPFSEQDKGDALPLSDGTEIWWEDKQKVEKINTNCVFGPCVHWQGTIQPGEEVRLTAQYKIVGSSYTWWQSSDVELSNGKEYGMNEVNSGTFSDIQDPRYMNLKNLHGYFVKDKMTWFKRVDYSTGQESHAIDGDDSTVQAVAQQIHASIPADKADNAFVFAHTAFIYVRDQVQYQKGLMPPRSGPVCLAQGIGDCDEQSNAWMSILRVKGIPTWYEFGALTDTAHTRWEGHGWANVALPFSEEYCAAQEIDLRFCHLEASVDVVNNKWLLHTPTALSEWVEIPPRTATDTSGQMVLSFYQSLDPGTPQWLWEEEWHTISGPENDGTFSVRHVEGL